MDTYTSLLIAGFFFVMGAAVVGLIWYVVGLTRRIRSKKKGITSGDANLAEVAGLLRDKLTQDLVVEMDGKTFRTVQELSSGQEHKLNIASTVLAKWLSMPVPEPIPAEEPVATTHEIAPEAAMPMPAFAEPMEEKLDNIPPFMVEPIEEVKPVSTDLPDLVGGFIIPPVKPAPAFKSIAMQINDILQANLVGTPLESRGITVNDAPDQGVIVTLDGEKYSGVKEVPDEEVRKAIKAAVLEWETKK